MSDKTRRVILEGLIDYYDRKRVGLSSGPRYVHGWPESVIARYLTVGKAHVDITYDSSSPVMAVCGGCEWSHSDNTPIFHTDTPEQETDKVTDAVEFLRDEAQQHAHACSGVPMPGQR